LLVQNTLLSTLFSNSLSLCSAITIKYQVSHPYETTDEFYKVVLHVHFPLLRSYQNIRPSRRSCVIFLNRHFYRELLAPRPTPNLEDHFLLAARDCLFNIFAATFDIWRPSPPSTTWGRVMSWWQGIHCFILFISFDC
jgi:hypothetical protein